MLHDIWPLIVAKFNNATLTVVGKSLPSRLKKQARAMGITVQGEVPQILPEYKKADVLLAPMRIGGGTKFKILEAMACHLPVVTTRQGILGLPVVDKKHVLVGDTPSEIVEACVQLVSDPFLQKKLMKAARHLIEKHFSWSVISDTLDSVWRSVYEQNN